jgi:hypothetical protein
LSAERPLRPLRALLLPVAAAALLAGCGSGSGQSGNAFVFLSVDLFSVSGATPVSNVTSNLGDRGATTSVCVTLRNNLKNPTLTAPSPLDNITVTQYTTSINRLDGNTVAPGPFTFNVTFTIPAGTAAQGVVSNNTARLPIILVPAQAKSEPPLLPRPTVSPLSTVATILFKGRDQRGEEVEAQGSISLTFIFDQETAEPPAVC